MYEICYTYIHMQIHYCRETIYTYIYTLPNICVYTYKYPVLLVDASYGVALVSRIDKIIGLFCKRAL